MAEAAFGGVVGEEEVAGGVLHAARSRIARIASERSLNGRDIGIGPRNQYNRSASGGALMTEERSEKFRAKTGWSGEHEDRIAKKWRRFKDLKVFLEHGLIYNEQEELF